MSPGGTVPDFFGTGAFGSTWMGWMGTFPICFKWAAGEPQNFQNHWVTRKLKWYYWMQLLHCWLRNGFLDAMSFLDVVFLVILKRLWPLQSCRKEVTTWDTGRMIVVQFVSLVNPCLVMPTHCSVARKAKSERSCAHHSEELYDDEMTVAVMMNDDHRRSWWSH